jgi:hypothetical protein
MIAFGTRKDGRHYPKSVGDPSKGISKAEFERLQAQDAHRSRIAKAIDNKKRATIDYEGQHWRASPNRYDVKGIDDPATLRKKKETERFLANEVKNYINKHKAALKPQLDAMTMNERKDFERDLQGAVKRIGEKGVSNLTKKDLKKLAASIAVFEIMDAR